MTMRIIVDFRMQFPIPAAIFGCNMNIIALYEHSNHLAMGYKYNIAIIAKKNNYDYTKICLGLKKKECKQR